MKLLAAFLASGFWPTVLFASAQVTGGGRGTSDLGAGKASFAEEGSFDAGVTVHAMAPGDQPVGDNVIKNLEADGGTTGETPRPPRPVRARNSSGACSPQEQTAFSTGWHRITPEAHVYLRYELVRLCP